MTSVSIRKKLPTVKNVKSEENIESAESSGVGTSDVSNDVKDDYDEESCLPKENCLKALAGKEHAWVEKLF